MMWEERKAEMKLAESLADVRSVCSSGVCLTEFLLRLCSRALSKSTKFPQLQFPHLKMSDSGSQPIGVFKDQISGCV